VDDAACRWNHAAFLQSEQLVTNGLERVPAAGFQMEVKTMRATMKTLLIALLAIVGLSGCVAYPVYESPRASYYAPAPVYGYYSYSSRPYYGYRSYYNSRDHW
jgi:hypothetical protein